MSKSQDEEKKDRAFDYVLDHVTDEALKKLNLSSDYHLLVSNILLYMGEDVPEEYVVSRVLGAAKKLGLAQSKEEIERVAAEVIEKCPRHRFALELAINDIEEYNLSGEEVFNGIHGFLMR